MKAYSRTTPKTTGHGKPSGVHTRPHVSSVDAEEAFNVESPLPEAHVAYEYSRSIVRVQSVGMEQDYAAPWQAPKQRNWRGSGFVIEGNLILTNAHVGSDNKMTRVRLAEDSKWYKARILQEVVGNDCDLALVTVDDPEFWAKTTPLEIGEMIKKEQRVKVVGFPILGEEICSTQGFVSRVEVHEYVHSGVALLAAQVDAAINPGNSGGPVISDGKVVGVAFQGADYGDGNGFIIPVPVIKHYIEEASTGVYNGFPELPIVIQHLENPNLRRSLGMKEDQTGVRVVKVDKLSSAYGLLKANDVILSIEGITVQNDARVNLPYAARLDLNHVFHTKFVGDKIGMRVLRDGVERNIYVQLNETSTSTKLVSCLEHEKRPTYYIASGIVVMPVTENYLYTDTGNYLVDVEIDGVGISDVEKSYLDEQLLIINRILPYDEAEGYENYDNEIVSKLNGIEIRNIEHFIDLYESAEDDYFTIETKRGELIHLPKMSEEAHQELLSSYFIHEDRSIDLQHTAPSVDFEHAADSSHSSEDADEDVIAEDERAQYQESSEEADDELDDFIEPDDGKRPNYRFPSHGVLHAFYQSQQAPQSSKRKRLPKVVEADESSSEEEELVKRPHKKSRGLF